jgi:hypothetical protein
MNPMLTLDEMLTFTELMEVHRNTTVKYRFAKRRYERALALGMTAAEINETVQTCEALLSTLEELDKCASQFMLAGVN